MYNFFNVMEKRSAGIFRKVIALWKGNLLNSTIRFSNKNVETWHKIRNRRVYILVYV